jgi:polygalacturonase
MAGGESSWGVTATNLTRRAFFGTAATALARSTDAGPWGDAALILSRITRSKFPNRDFDITKFGAVGDGTKDCTAALAKTIAACADAGGGRVVVPSGVFLTGAIHLKSNVNLHVSEGATLKFSNDPKAYLPVVFTRWEGTECMNYSPLVYAFEQTNIGLTGGGALDGQADSEHWWPWKGRSPKKDANVHPTVPVHERSYRGSHHPELADVGGASETAMAGAWRFRVRT